MGDGRAHAYSDVVVTSKNPLEAYGRSERSEDLLSSGCQTTLAIGVKMDRIDGGIVVVP